MLHFRLLFVKPELHYLQPKAGTHLILFYTWQLFTLLVLVVLKFVLIIGNLCFKGKNGEKGSRGNPGLSILPGEMGESGEPGPKGEPGSEGYQGLKGSRGFDGFKGIKGEKGAPGLYGSIGPAVSIALQRHTSLFFRT